MLNLSCDNHFLQCELSIRLEKKLNNWLKILLKWQTKQIYFHTGFVFVHYCLSNKIPPSPDDRWASR